MRERKEFQEQKWGWGSRAQAKCEHIFHCSKKEECNVNIEASTVMFLDEEGNG
jgi:hypothetical protein